MSDVLYATRYGPLTAVTKVSKAMKKKIFSGYFIEVTELDAHESERCSVTKEKWVIGVKDFSRIVPLFRIELWGPAKN